jgi:chemotaxis protein histidine kinase CheA
LYTIAATFAAANPIAAAILILGSAFIIGANAASNLTTELEKNKLAADSLNPELNATAYEVEFVGGKMGILAGATSNATRETRRLRDELLLLQTVQGLSVYGGGKDLRSAMAADNRKKGSAAAQAAAAQNAAVAAAAKAAQEQAAREQLVAQQQAAREQLAAQEQAARELADAQEQAFRTEEERLRKRADAYESFSDSVKSIFGGIKESILSAFSLPDLGNSVGSITRNIKKLLEQTKNFARNINSLSQQGLTNDLLQQVIAAGPMKGGRLAASLAGAGAGFIGQLNQAYGEFGGIASGIAGVGTTSAFANREVINNYYQIEVSGGVGSGPTIGKAIVDAIKSYERTSGAVWQGA